MTIYVIRSKKNAYCKSFRIFAIAKYSLSIGLEIGSVKGELTEPLKKTRYGTLQ